MPGTVPLTIVSFSRNVQMCVSLLNRRPIVILPPSLSDPDKLMTVHTLSCREPKSLRIIGREPNGSCTIVPNHLFCDMLYRDLTLSVGTQKAMPEARLTWTKRVGAEPKTTKQTQTQKRRIRTEKMAMYTWREPHHQLDIKDWSPKIEKYMNQ